MDLIKEAIKNSQYIENEDAYLNSIKIAVIGVGGAGCNAINRLYNMNIQSAETIAINTDSKHLDMINAHKKLLIGKNITRGLGAGGHPDIAEKAAQNSAKEIRELLQGKELVFLSAGMGGGTGTGASPVVARIAKEEGAIVVGIVTYPFKLERIRLKKAEEGIRKLIKEVDTLIIIDNNKLLEYAPNLPINQAFALADSIIGRAVKGITDTISLPSLLNIDFADVKATLSRGKLSMISLGEAKGPDRIEKVVESTLHHPLLDIDYEGANGALIHIEGSPDLTIGEAVTIGEKLTQAMIPDGEVKVGARLNPELEDEVRVTAIITNVKSPNILSKEETKSEFYEEIKDEDLQDILEEI